MNVSVDRMHDRVEQAKVPGRRGGHEGRPQGVFRCHASGKHGVGEICGNLEHCRPNLATARKRCFRSLVRDVSNAPCVAYMTDRTNTVSFESLLSVVKKTRSKYQQTNETAFNGK